MCSLDVLGAYWNISDLLEEGQAIEGEFEDHNAIRVWAVSLKFQVLTLILRPKISTTEIEGIIRGSKNRAKFKVSLFLLYCFIYIKNLFYQVKLRVQVNTVDAITDLHSRNHSTNTSTTETVQFRPFTGLAPETELEPKQLISSRNILSLPTLSRRGRKLLDTFADSLLHVNRLYNKAFGFEARKVPAHSAHLIDKDVMFELQERFPVEWDRTSSHKFRSPQDMQFAFSYYYFLFHEKENTALGDIFDSFDSDLSG